MSEHTEDGGPCFPCERHKLLVDTKTGEHRLVSNPDSGMSLRDYFAAQALGLWTIDYYDLKKIQCGLEPDHELIAKFCYDLADAMLKKRTQK